MIRLIYNNEFLEIGEANIFEVLDVTMLIFNTDNIRIYYRNGKVIARHYTDFTNSLNVNYNTPQDILDELDNYKSSVLNLIQPDYNETDSSKKTFIKNKLPFGETEFNLKADKSYVDALSLGLNWRDPVELVNVIGNTSTPIVGNDLDGYIIDTGGNIGAWSSFSPGDLVQKQGSVWVKIKSLQVGDRLGVNFKNSSTPIGSFSGKSNNLVEIVGGVSGSFTYSFTPASNSFAVFVQSSNAFFHNVSFVYSNSLSRWVQLRASTNRVFSSDFELLGNTVNLNITNTKNSLNLDEVDNTSDLNKPISNATQLVLNNKANINHIHTSSDISDFNTAVKSAETTTSLSKNSGTVSFTDEDGNITSFNKIDLNLGNVDNISDLNKPISTATQTALNSKASSVHIHTLSNVTDVTITVANLNSLDDGVNSTLHFHDSDRNRANHTGTQTASTISDFNTSVDTRIANTVINTLSDVVITTPTNGQVLKYDGTNWINDVDNTSVGSSGLTFLQTLRLNTIL